MFSSLAPNKSFLIYFLLAASCTTRHSSASRSACATPAFLHVSSVPSSDSSNGPIAVLLASLRRTAGRAQPGSVWYSSVKMPVSGTNLQRFKARRRQ